MNPIKFDKVYFDVGHQFYSTNLDTINKYPNCKLATYYLAPENDHRQSDQDHILIDRDGKHFGTILSYMNNDSCLNDLYKWSDRALEELQMEAQHYELDKLATECARIRQLSNMKEILVFKNVLPDGWLELRGRLAIVINRPFAVEDIHSRKRTKNIHFSALYYYSPWYNMKSLKKYVSEILSTAIASSEELFELVDHSFCDIYIRISTIGNELMINDRKAKNPAVFNLFCPILRNNTMRFGARHFGYWKVRNRILETVVDMVNSNTSLLNTNNNHYNVSPKISFPTDELCGQEE